MLKDRGYDVADSDIEMTKEQFVDKYGEKMERKDLVTLKVKRNDDSDKVCSYVFFLIFFTILLFLASTVFDSGAMFGSCSNGTTLYIESVQGYVFCIFSFFLCSTSSLW